MKHRLNRFLSSSSGRTALRARYARPRLESLEDRLTPSILWLPDKGIEHATPGSGQVLGTAGDTPIYTIFWGSFWATQQGQALAGRIENSINPMFRDSTYLDGLHQYGVGQRARVPDYGTVEAFNFSDPAIGFTNDDVKATVIYAMQHQGLPGPDDSNPGVYFVITAPDAQYARPDSAGWHTYGSVGGNRFYFGWISNDAFLDDVTSILSHELVESMTDPNENAWRVDPTGDFGDRELCDGEDHCQRVNGYLVQLYWSQADEAFLFYDTNRQKFFVDEDMLYVIGDQLGQPCSDTVIVDVNGLGGPWLSLNGEVESFDPSQFIGLTVSTGGGTNAVWVNNESAYLDLTINNASDDRVVIGEGSVQGVQANVTIRNPTHHTDLTIDDSADPSVHTVDIDATSVVGLLPNVAYVRRRITFDNLSHLSIWGGSSGNTFQVHDTPAPYDPSQGGPGFTYLASGSGQDTVDVLGTTGDLYVDGVSGLDFVQLGSERGSSGQGLLNQILGAVHVSSINGTTYLYVDDTADTTSRSAILSNGVLTGLSPAPIYWTPTPWPTGGVTTVAVWGGNAGNTFEVNNTSALYNRTYLVTGNGANTVYVQGTTGALSVNTGSGPANSSVILGWALLGRRSMANLHGSVTLTTPVNHTFLTLDDSLDSLPRTAVFTDALITGLSPAFIETDGNMQALTVVGGSGGVQFDFRGTRAPKPTRLYGGAGSDTLVGPDTGASWALTGSDTGKVNSFLTFTGVENLVGGAGNDNIVLLPAGQVSGSIDGGGGANRLDYSVDGGQASTVNLATGSATRVGSGAALRVANIGTLVGSSAGTDTVIGADAVNRWLITGANTGYVGTFRFAGVENLTGGSSADTFRFYPAGSLSGNLDGGSDVNWLDYSLFSTGVTVNLATGVVPGVTGRLLRVENAIGGSGNDTLIGNALGNILIGGPGNDTLLGGAGRSLLIGGLGSDSLVGGSGDDILVAGRTAYDANSLALQIILGVWQQTGLDYSTRIADLRTGVGWHQAYRLVWGTTVADDGAADSLTGGAGLDWFFANPGPSGITDTITDLDVRAGEQIN
jgi:Ca2+-binding RTX toxin-like protein